MRTYLYTAQNFIKCHQINFQNIQKLFQLERNNVLKLHRCQGYLCHFFFLVSILRMLYFWIQSVWIRYSICFCVAPKIGCVGRAFEALQNLQLLNVNELCLWDNKLHLMKWIRILLIDGIYHLITMLWTRRLHSSTALRSCIV